MNEDQIGNITTIIKILIMTIAPTIAVYLGVDQNIITTFLTALLALLLALLDAKYPNTFKYFDNDKPVLETEEPVLNPEYECDESEC